MQLGYVLVCATSDRDVFVLLGDPGQPQQQGIGEYYSGGVFMVAAILVCCCLHLAPEHIQAFVSRFRHLLDSIVCALGFVTGGGTRYSFVSIFEGFCVQHVGLLHVAVVVLLCQLVHWFNGGCVQGQLCAIAESG